MPSAGYIFVYSCYHYHPRPKICNHSFIIVYILSFSLLRICLFCFSQYRIRKIQLVTCNIKIIVEMINLINNNNNEKLTVNKVYCVLVVFILFKQTL
jgi:hypothetical protein